MTADIKLLPLPSAKEQVWVPAGGGIKSVEAGDTYYAAEQMESYARAVAEHNVATRDAEIEALREDARRSATDYQMLRDFADRETVRAERLAEALREARDMVEDWAGYASEYFQDKHDLQGDLAKLDAALRDHDQEGKDG